MKFVSLLRSIRMVVHQDQRKYISMQENMQIPKKNASNYITVSYRRR
nr:MAG TPA: hypothetical protein [Caudoviricetes sp.]